MPWDLQPTFSFYISLKSVVQIFSIGPNNDQCAFRSDDFI